LFDLIRNSIILTALFCAITGIAQTGCPSVDVLTIDGLDALELDCDDPCVTLEANPFETGSTDDYEVESIPFAPPYPFNQGTSLFIGTDDTYSPLIALPFEFCFYGINYSGIVVGSNGVITFDAGEADGYCPWAFIAAAPSANLPTNAIFGVYYDIDPSDCGSVRYEIIGEEPCRTFLVNYDNVCHFSCGSLTTSSQIVFYETTNTIDIYIEDKPTCSGWNSGNSLVGIQNNTGTLATVPPGRNTGPWTANDEAWRFTPSGGAPTYTVEWFEEGVSLGTGDTIEICPTETTNYSATATYDGCGGDDTQVSDDFVVTVTIDIEDAPNPAILNNQALCTSLVTYQLEAQDPGGFWAADCGDCIDQNGLLDLSAVDEGEYNISYELEGQCGPVSDFIIIEIYEDAVATLTALNPICNSAEAVQIVAVETNGVWSADCGDCIDADGFFNPAGLAEGTYDVVYTINSACPDNDQITVEIVAQDDAGFILPVNICENATPILIPVDQTGGEWTSDCETCISVNGTFDPTTAEEGNYTLTYTFDSDCPDFQSSTIEVINVVAPVIAPPDIQCESADPLEIQANVDGGTWTADCGNCINSATGVFQPGTGPGTYQLTYTVGDQCVVSDNESIQVVQQLSAAITALDTLCTEGAAVNLVSQDDGGTWSANCASCIDPVDGSFDPSVGPGTYTVEYIISGLCGDNDSQDFIVDFSDDATINEVTTYCLGWGDVQLSAAQNGGAWSADCGDCIDAVSGVFNTELAGQGFHEISHTFNGVCGSIDSEGITVTANDPSTILGVSGYCLDAGTIQMEGATPGGFWTASCNNCITANGFFTPTIAGIGVHSITYTIQGQCGTISARDIEVYPLPQPAFTVDETSGCIPHTVTFTQTNLEQGACQWGFGDGAFSSNCNQASHTYTSAGCFDVSLSVTSFDGCSNSVQINDITCGLSLPTSAFLYAPTQPTTDDPLIVLTEEATNEIDYSWSYGGYEFADEPEVEFNTLDVGELEFDICLTAIDVNGCTDLFCRTVDVIEKLRVFVPNAFTPDGDGVNEVWFPVVIGAIEYDVKVFNRWGEVVFSSQVPGEPWIGEVKNGEYFARNDLYTYILVVQGDDLETYEYSGHVMLLR
jgi:gliding motility-associated-like protein